MFTKLSGLPYRLKCQFSVKLEVTIQTFYTRCKKSLNIRLMIPQPKGMKSISSFLQTLLHPKRPTLNIMQHCDIPMVSLYGSINVSANAIRVLHSSSRTVHSESSVSINIEAIAPSLNSKDVPPSTTIQASQQRERTQTLQKPSKSVSTKQLKNISISHKHIAVKMDLRHSLLGPVSA